MTYRATRQERLLFVLWTSVIILLVVPWGSVQDHAHWSRVAWLPFLSPPVRAGDIARNVLLYLPWGYLLARHTDQTGMSGWKVAAYALMLSLGTEATQVMSHGRFPSATDVTCNVAGAWIGGRWALRFRRIAR